MSSGTTPMYASSANDKIYVVTSFTEISYTTNGTTWNDITMPNSRHWGFCAYNGSIYVITVRDGSNIIATSTTGLAGSWTERTLPSSTNQSTITACGSTFIIGSSNEAKNFISNDGISWTQVTSAPFYFITSSPTSYSCCAVDYTNRLIYTSP